MNSSKHSSGTYRSYRFIKLLGAECDLAYDSGMSKRFYLSAKLIAVIMALTCISIYYAIVLLFHSIAIEIILAVFFSLLFVCIYIFLLNTFSKENRRPSGLFNISNIIRIGFIAFMGFLIAQPLVIFLYASSLATDVDYYKQQLLKTHNTKISNLTKEEILHLTDQYRYYNEQKTKFGTSLYNTQLSKIDDALKVIQAKTTALEYATQQTIHNNSFFLYRIKTLHQIRPLSWVFTLFIIMLFLLPGYLIYTISGQDDYYLSKKNRERRLILEVYDSFLDTYKRLFNNQITVFSRYEDPPFNTLRKQPPVAATMSDFVQKYLDKD